MKYQSIQSFEVFKDDSLMKAWKGFWKDLKRKRGLKDENRIKPLKLKFVYDESFKDQSLLSLKAFQIKVQILKVED